MSAGTASAADIIDPWNGPGFLPERRLVPEANQY